MRSYLQAAVAALVLALTLMAPAAGRASGGLSVSPITVEFGADGDPRAMEISNPGDQPIHVQLRMFAWSVDADGDHHDPTTDIGFSPPMFALEAGATQVVRLAPMKAAGARERAYRLYVDQLPNELEPGQLQMPVRMVLPVFISAQGAPVKPTNDALTWRITFDEKTRNASLIAQNTGERRVKLINLAYTQSGAAQPIRQGLAGYVLAGQSRTWEFPYSGLLRTLEITAQSEAGPLAARVSFPAR